MMYNMMPPITMEVDLNKTDRMAVDLWRGKIMDMDNKIQLYKDYRHHLYTQIAKTVGEQLLRQYLKDYDPQVGQVIVNYDFNCMYMLDRDMKLKLIESLEEKK